MDDAQRERAMAGLTLLEGRRQEHAGAMWQAPTLTLVAQSFLLGLLTDKAVDWAVALAVAVAGVFASGSAMYALALLRDREREFGERVRQQALALGLGDPNRTRKQRRWYERPLESRRGWLLWEAVLFALIVADVLALILTRC